uniref:Protein-L-isoaspartate O-methyltransferase domain-containing protein 1 n=1 Tax=Parascaris univalens TaxID=6257 RepID=A0A915AI54_PARUN
MKSGMGLAASTGRNNYELVDKLKEAGLVQSDEVEKVLRLVDRGRFFPVEARDMAYRDIAWKSEHGTPGRLHISAPCIYANVLEHLNLSEGNSFLNVGSGTGYLNTLVGFLIGSSGVNHGIEIHENIVAYARERIDEWIRSPETQCFDWAVPEFTCGNGLNLSPLHDGRYDRVYCGAAVPMSRRNALLDLIKVGGILVMPYQDQLEQIHRVKDDTFHVKILTSVSFSDFILPTVEEIRGEQWSSAPPFTVSTLQHASALTVRRSVRAAMARSYMIHIRRYATTHDSASEQYQPAVIFVHGPSLREQREQAARGRRRMPLLPVYATPLLNRMRQMVRRRSESSPSTSSARSADSRNGLAAGDLGVRVEEADENVDDDSGEVFGIGLVDGEEARDVAVSRDGPAPLDVDQPVQSSNAQGQTVPSLSSVDQPVQDSNTPVQIVPSPHSMDHSTQNSDAQDEAVLFDKEREVAVNEQDVKRSTEEDQNIDKSALDHPTENGPNADPADTLAMWNRTGKRSWNESDSDNTDVKKHIKEQMTGTGHVAESAARNNTEMLIDGDGGHIELEQATVAGRASEAAIGIDSSTSIEHNGCTRDGDVYSTEQKAAETEAVESSGVEPSDGDGNIDGPEVPPEPDRSVDELNISLDSVATRGSSENAPPTEADFDDSDNNSDGSPPSPAASITDSIIDFAEEHMQFEGMADDAEDELRDAEQNQQTEDIGRFSAEFERRLADLPLTVKDLIQMHGRGQFSQQIFRSTVEWRVMNVSTGIPFVA